MSKAIITEASLDDIGDAIREQLGVTTKYLPSEMGNAVRQIGGGGGTTDYSLLTNKPQINSVELNGNKSSSDLGLQDQLTFDASPTSSSTNPVTSGGVYTALGAKVDTSAIGTANGVAELDAAGHVPSSQLPSYVDDVIEGYYDEATDKFYEDASHTTEITGETGKIYIALDTNLSYRWTGSGFAVISPSLALGETSSTAYRGDRGKTAYNDSQENKAAIGQIFNDISDAYSDSQTYSVGDYCIYNNTLYKCITAVTSAEPFDSSKWSSVSVMDEIGQNASAISALNSSKQDVIKYKTESLTFTSGHREVRLSDLGITVNHLINVYSYSTGYDITFNYEANGTVNMVCRSDTTYSGDLNVIIVYV